MNYELGFLVREYFKIKYRINEENHDIDRWDFPTKYRISQMRVRDNKTIPTTGLYFMSRVNSQFRHSIFRLSTLKHYLILKAVTGKRIFSDHLPNAFPTWTHKSLQTHFIIRPHNARAVNFDVKNDLPWPYLSGVVFMASENCKTVI